jgi:hypothetical protein
LDSEANASVCRGVGLDFVNEVARQADPRRFVAWARDYQHVTLAAEWDPHDYALTVASAGASSLHEARRARSRVLTEFERLIRGDESFARDCIQRGLLTRTYNVLAVAAHTNECGWIPLDLRDVPLAARVLALFAVDYIWAPAPYRENLYVCRRCGAVGFDADRRRRGLCLEHSGTRSVFSGHEIRETRGTCTRC